MSNMPEINLDEVGNESRVIAVLRRHQALVKVNRALLVLVFVLMLAVVSLGLVLLPNYSVLNSGKPVQVADANYALQNPVISAEINTLKGQMFSLVSGSIESKLRSLEENIKRGSVADSLNTLQDLKSDVKVLNAYSVDNQQNRAQDIASNQQMVKELTDLKDLVYLTFVSCGLMIAAVAGVWFRRRRITHQQEYRAYLSRHD
jgi:hypothetical protein